MANLASRMKNLQIRGQVISWTVSSLLGEKRLSSYLNEDICFSKRLIKLAKSSDGLILVNGKHRTVRYLITEGDHIVIKLPDEINNTSLKATQIPLEIIYEDDHLMVLNKVAGRVSVPSSTDQETSLANGILYYYLLKNLPYTVHIVTRLDRDTSGLVLVAKHQYAHSLLANLQLKNEIKRVYIGFIKGHLKESHGVINQPIGRTNDSIIKREVNNRGRKAITYYKVLKEYLNHTAIQIKLETGRTHQIRVHFAHIGHPLLGDDLYGNVSKYIKRQALHCKTLKFTHPITQEKLQINAPLPKDFLEMIDKIS